MTECAINLTYVKWVPWFGSVHYIMKYRINETWWCTLQSPPKESRGTTRKGRQCATSQIELVQTEQASFRKDLASSWLCYIREKPIAGTVAFGCSLYHFWTAIKLHCLGQFTWFKKLDPLTSTLPSASKCYWKDQASIYLGIGPILALKSTIFPSLTENCFQLYMMALQIKVVSCENYFQLASEMVYI